MVKITKIQVEGEKCKYYHFDITWNADGTWNAICDQPNRGGLTSCGKANKLVDMLVDCVLTWELD